MDIWQILMTPFSWILKQFIILFDSYGIALFLFTIVIKVILFPLSLKGKKSMIQMNVLSSQQQEIQKRYPNDRAKQQEALSKLYADNNINPMGGCLWSLLSMFILFPLYAVIRRPFKYLFGLTETATTAVATLLGWVGEFKPGQGMAELTLASWLNSENLSAAIEAAKSNSLFLINFDFLGVDLSQIPTFKFWQNDITWGAIGLFLLPIISACMSVVSSLIMQKTNAMNKNQEAAAAKQNRTMLLMMPAMSLWIGFTLPAGLCVYWISNSILSVAQELLAGKILKKDYEEAQRKMAEQTAKAKAYEKERRRLAAERKAAALADKKTAKKTTGTAKPSVNPADSRVGMRTYARGRSYDPARYPVTPYHDPDAKATSVVDETVEIEEETVTETPVLDTTPVTEAPVVEETVVCDDSADYEAPYAEETDDDNEN